MDGWETTIIFCCYFKAHKLWIFYVYIGSFSNPLFNSPPTPIRPPRLDYNWIKRTSVSHASPQIDIISTSVSTPIYTYTKSKNQFKIDIGQCLSTCDHIEDLTICDNISNLKFPYIWQHIVVETRKSLSCTQMHLWRYYLQINLHWRIIYIHIF